MSRPLRIEFPGAVYHVTSRGDRREPIFDDEEDRRSLLGTLAETLERHEARALAWCLMDNHYHFVLHTLRPNLSRLMRDLNGVYTQAYNRRHGKTGHLFQGRFKGILVDRDSYLLEVCRYVDLNPVRAGMVKEPGDWPWSSYRALTGAEAPPAWLDRDVLHAQLLGREVATAADRRSGARRYATLVAAGRDVRLWDEALRKQIFLGDQDFIDRMQALAEPERARSRAIPRQQRRPRTKTVAQYLAAAADRNAGLVQAHLEGGHTLTAIAREAGLSISTVSRVVAAALRSREG